MGNDEQSQASRALIHVSDLRGMYVVPLSCLEVYKELKFKKPKSLKIGTETVNNGI